MTILPNREGPGIIYSWRRRWYLPESHNLIHPPDHQSSVHHQHISSTSTGILNTGGDLDGAVSRFFPTVEKLWIWNCKQSGKWEEERGWLGFRGEVGEFLPRMVLRVMLVEADDSTRQIHCRRRRLLSDNIAVAPPPPCPVLLRPITGGGRQDHDRQSELPQLRSEVGYHGGECRTGLSELSRITVWIDKGSFILINYNIWFLATGPLVCIIVHFILINRSVLFRYKMCSSPMVLMSTVK